VIDLLGGFFYLCILVGMILLSLKSKWGWIARLIGEVGWVGLGWAMGMVSIWGFGVVFVIIDLCGFLKWRRDEAN
jgi:hypothetical protein